MPIEIPRLTDALQFPPVSTALKEPNGLLAMGGDLQPERLLTAYRHGIFPWYSEGDPILWWSPDPRLVLFPNELKVSRSLQKACRGNFFKITMNADFDAVIQACAQPRKYEKETWITSEMMQAYSALHRLGYAHSVEVWDQNACGQNTGDQNKLVGGLYGVALGKVFFGESMFSTKRDASKVAFVHLVQSSRYELIDCQVTSEHLMRLGAKNIPRNAFITLLNDLIGLGKFN